MLKELYDYAYSENLTAIPGFKERKIDAYVSLDKDGNLIGIVPSEYKKVFAPDLGSMANGTQKCNILISKAEYVIGLGDGNDLVKHEFFKSALKEASEYEPMFRVVSDFLDDDKCLEELKTEFKNSKFKADSVVGFMIDGKPIETFVGYYEWWQKFRKEQCGEAVGNRVCIITGNESSPVATVPKVNGLMSVGGHTSGDAIICFDKAAFCSYGFKQGENASVSEEAITAVNAALEKLLRDAPIHAKTKFVHWYKESMVSDYMKILDEDWSEIFSISDDVDEEESDENDNTVDKTEIKKLVKSIRNGEKPTMPNNIYYIMPLSGGGGRIMVRGFEEGRCEELHNSIKAWFEDMDLVKIGGGLLPTPKLSRIYKRLIKHGGDKDIRERIQNELSGLDNAIIRAIIKGYPIPDSVATRTLAYIRSEMYSEDSSGFVKHPDSICCQILKVWLIRRNKKMESLVNENYPSNAYQLGRLFAVYAAIQKKSSPEVNVGVVERYYSSASIKPAFVLGKLASLSQYHLSNIAKSNQGSAVYYSKMLSDISCKVKLPMPSVLTTEEQAEFALGYYQQCAEIFKSKKETTNDQEEF